MKNTLITGGSGLVGSAIAGGIKVSSKNANLMIPAEADALFEELQPEKVIHCAGRVGGLGGNMNYLGEYFYENIMINTNVLEAARKVGCKKVLSFLSTCVFPEKVDYPITENQFHNGPPHESNFAYAYAKRMLEVQSRAYNKQYSTNYVGVIPTNIYGPNDNFDLKNGHVAPSLIHRCFLAKENNEDLVVWGSGKPLREFIYSEDIANLSMWAIDNYTEEEPIIFSTNEEVSIEELVDTIVRHMHFKGKVIWDRTKPDGQFKKPASNTKLMSYLPDYEFISLEEGMGRTIDWFNSNYHQIRK